MSTKPSALAAGEDLEATAELPVADFAPASEGAPDAGTSTDVFPVPTFQAGNSELADRLREVEQRLHRKGERVRQLETQLDQAIARHATLEVRLAQTLEGQAELEAQLVKARAQSQQQSRLVLESRAAAARHHTEDLMELRARSERQHEALTSWQGFRAMSDVLLADAEARHALLEAQIATLVQSLRALEDERDRGPASDETAALRTQVAELKSEVGALHTELLVVQERQPHPAQDVDAGDRRDTAAAGPLPGVLVRQEGTGERVYLIGRRTTIGRTSDNDIQIDAHNVSRHHAVLLTSADHCLVEDLNSTNGVLVNGRRVIRHVLREGDTVKIGKTEFTYRQRS